MVIRIVGIAVLGVAGLLFGYQLIFPDISDRTNRVLIALEGILMILGAILIALDEGRNEQVAYLQDGYVVRQVMFWS